MENLKGAGPLQQMGKMDHVPGFALISEMIAEELEQRQAERFLIAHQVAKRNVVMGWECQCLEFQASQGNFGELKRKDSDRGLPTGKKEKQAQIGIGRETTKAAVMPFPQVEKMSPGHPGNNLIPAVP